MGATICPQASSEHVLPVKSVTYVLLLMRYCLQACEQLTLQLEMGATTCPQTSSEHVLPRNSLLAGLCKISHLCATAYVLLLTSL